MPNEQNLIPNNKRSPSEVRKNGKKGGIKSGEVRRKKADLRKAFIEAISLPYVSGKMTKILEEQGIELTNEQAIVISTIREITERGNMQALDRLLDITGTINNAEVNSERIEIINDLPVEEVIENE